MVIPYLFAVVLIEQGISDVFLWVCEDDGSPVHSGVVACCFAEKNLASESLMPLGLAGKSEDYLMSVGAYSRSARGQVNVGRIGGVGENYLRRDVGHHPSALLILFRREMRLLLRHHPHLRPYQRLPLLI